MKQAVLVAAVLLALWGCSPDAGKISDAKEAVARDTGEPSAVQYREVRTVRQADGSDVVCGEYNAKNLYGGYVGFQPFAYVDGAVYSNDEGADSINLITRHCLQGMKTDAQVSEERAKLEADYTP